LPSDPGGFVSWSWRLAAAARASSSDAGSCSYNSRICEADEKDRINIYSNLDTHVVRLAAETHVAMFVFGYALDLIFEAMPATTKNTSSASAANA
jgi:hypothetical protein